MINSIKISNFQAHRDTTVEFSDGLNIITAKHSDSKGSDIGKTSILRAISWIVNGRPTGFDFHSNWCGHGDKTEVKIDFDNGYVGRWKSKSKNQWDCNGLELNATGQTVPSEVVDFVNWGDLNYQDQHDGAFLLSDTDGQVAKKLNELVNLDIIDKTIAGLTSRVKATNKNIEIKKEQVESIDEQIEKYDDLDKAISDFDKLSSLENQYFTLDDSYRDLSVAIERIEETENELKEFGNIEECIGDLGSLLDSLAFKDGLSKSISFLSNSLSSVISTHNELKNYNNVDKAISEIDCLLSLCDSRQKHKMSYVALNGQILVIEHTEKELAGFGDLDNVHSSLEKLIEWKNELNEKEIFKVQLEEKIEQIKSMVADIKSEEDELGVLENKFKEALGDRCPLCESKI